MTRRNRVPKLVAAGVASVLLLFGALPATAGAAPKSAQSKVTLKITNGLMSKRLNPFKASGRVSSKVGRCERRRQVELTYRPSEGDAQPYGEDATNGQGRYEIIVNVVPPGEYVAKVLPANRGETTCRGARSEPVVVSEVD